MAGRYHRQEAVAWFGPDGQAALARASLLVVGVGATGSQLLALLVRAGAGRIRFADDDRSHRKTCTAAALRGAGHRAAQGRGGRGALLGHQRRGGPEPRESRFTAETAPELLAGIDLVLDGTDNFAARFCINAHCLAAGIPWVYSGVAGDEG
jgi:adenylyltransferase/sulfurtransferase